jgi:hypothetical protein
MSKPITFEREGATCVLWVAVCEGWNQTQERPATPADLATAGFVRVPGVEELARILYEAEYPDPPKLTTWDRREEKARDEYRRRARAVLRALGVEKYADA